MPDPIPFPRPWHGASDRPDHPAVAALRAQRAEVDALLAFRHAPGGEKRAVAWWRLHGVRRMRIRMLTPQEAANLAALPPPPEEALDTWQRLRLRLGLLKLDQAAPPRRIARILAEP